VITTAIRLRCDYDVSRAPASNSTQAKNKHASFFANLSDNGDNDDYDDYVMMFSVQTRS